MKKIVIFDLDGTLINSIEDLADATNYALSKNGYSIHPLDKFYYFVGDGILKLIERAVPDGIKNKDEVFKVKKDFSDYYEKHFADKTKPYDGIQDVLKEISENGIIIAVASNKAEEFTKKIIDNIFTNQINMVVGQIDNIPKKPAPDMVHKILNYYNIDKKDAIFVGDTNIDILTAKNSGLTSVGCLWGFRTKQELSDAGADYIIANPHELINILQN